MENKELTTIDQPTNALVAIEQSRAVQEVQASLIIAKKFPRDEIKSLNKILEACKRPAFAKIATYSYKKGGAIVSDGSIRLAELMARSYGNLDYGVRELDQKEGVSTCESFCFDKETNTKNTKAFQVLHKYKAKGEMKELVDNRDIYEYVANQGARRLRACIFAIIPTDFKDEALHQIRATMAGDLKAKPLVDSIREITLLFKTHFQVTQEMLEKYLGHGMVETSVEELVDLQGIANSLRDKQTKREEWFGGGTVDVPASPLAEKLKNKKAEAEEKTEPVKKTDLQIAAGNIEINFWPDHPPVKICDIPENELVESLVEVEITSQKVKLSIKEVSNYEAACTYLNRQRNLKTK